jgi:hypothetical protein
MPHTDTESFYGWGGKRARLLEGSVYFPGGVPPSSKPTAFARRSGTCLFCGRRLAVAFKKALF